MSPRRSGTSCADAEEEWGRQQNVWLRLRLIFSPCRKAHDKKIAEAEEGGASASEGDTHRQPLKEAELSNGNAVNA